MIKDDRLVQWMIDKYYQVNQFIKQEEVGVLLGTTTPKDTPEASIRFFREWTDTIEQQLSRATPFSDYYASWMDKRFVSYEEFIDAIKHNREALQDENFLYYRFYEFFLVSSYSEKRALFTGIQPNYQGYIKLLQQTKNPVLQKFFSYSLRMKLPHDALLRHTHIIGKTGQGKSNLVKLIIYQLLKEPKKQSIVLIEPHGDLAKEVRDLAYHLKEPERLVYIDPYYVDRKLPVFNPFDISDTSDTNIDIYSQELTKTFVELLKEGTTLSGQMEAVLRPAISTLLRMKGSTLEDLQKLMDLEDSEVKRIIIKRGLENPFVTHRNMFVKVWGSDKIPTNYKTTINSIYTKIQTLFNTNIFYQLTCGNNGESTFDIEKLVNSGHVLIFNLSKGHIGSEASEAFGKFVVSFLQTVAFKRAKIPVQYRTPTFAIIDEFQQYVTSSINTIISESRKYGLHLLLSHQSIGQITDTKIRDTILGNTAIKIIGKSSKKTLKIMADEVDMELKEFKELQPYEFYIDAQSLKKKKVSTPYRIKASDRLIGRSKKFYQTKEEQEIIKKTQIRNYYADIKRAKKPINPSPKIERKPQEDKSGTKPKFKL